MRHDVITITKKVDVEIELSDVLEEFSLDQLLQNSSADEVLDSYEHYEIIDWAVSNLDISDLLDGIKNGVDADDITEWLDANPDMIPTKYLVEEEKEEKKETKPLEHILNELDDDGGILKYVRDCIPEYMTKAFFLNHPVVVMEKGEVRQVSQADPTIAHTYGTYTVFNNMVCVNAYGTEFVVSSIKDATQVLNALAFMTFNPKQEV